MTRTAILLSLFTAPFVLAGCSFIDDFGSFSEPDGGGVDSGPLPDGGGVDSGGVDAGPLHDGGSTCGAGTMDCDSNPATPCVDVATRINCGSCGHVCAAGESCVAGMCSGDPVVQLTAGDSFACALRMSGQVQCWGANSYGQLGTGTATPSEDIPHDVVGLPEPAVEIAAGYQHICARTASGHVYCWGENYYGELGNGTTSMDMPNPIPQLVGGLVNALAIACGYDSTCAVIGPAATAHVSCWGSNTYGELGVSIMDHGASSSPLDVTLAGGEIPTSIGCGYYDEYTCVRTTVGHAQCWGTDDQDELGPGATASPTPVVVVGTDNLADIRTGRTHICARTSSGSLVCWGEGDSGELGRVIMGSSTDPMPTMVPQLGGVIGYGVGSSHTCAIGTFGGDSTPQLYCFGSNSAGEIGLGMGTGSNYPMPQRVITAGTFAEVVAGDQFTCARRSDVSTHAVVCWGDNAAGQTGSGDSTVSDPRHLSPIEVVGL